MSETAERAFSTILHPTDFSASSNKAFEHALKIAVANRSHFSISHVQPEKSEGPTWSEFPQIRETLERWALLPKDSARSAVSEELGVHVKKVGRTSKNPVEAIAGFLVNEGADLVVLATEGREGLPRWLNPSFSEALVRRTSVATLFVPSGSQGFVSNDNGELSLKNILIPTDRKPYPGVGIEVLGGFLKSLKVQNPTIETLYVGDRAQMPVVSAPPGLPCSFGQLAREGKPVDEILNRADELDADLIVTVTEGQHGFLDALRGSTTEQIVRRATCPVLAVPAAG